MDEQTFNIIQVTLDEMEEELLTDISLEELASRRGYSPWHFARIFQRIVGMPVMQYRTRRRLMHALYAISNGVSITETALLYGFDTHAGFFKAFHQAYGCSPTEFLRRNKAPLPYPIILKEETFPMISNSQWKQALAAWNISLPLSPVVFPGSGRIHESRKRAGDTYVLKAFSDYEKCNFQVKMANALHSRHLPAEIPITSPQGETIIESNGLYYSLGLAIPGIPLRADEMLSGDIQENGKSIGMALRNLHLALDEMENCPITDRQDFLGMLQGWALPRVKALKILEDTWLDTYEEKIAALFPHLPKGPIHRDPNPSNLIKTKDNTIGFIDFDLAENNIRLYDPCYAATAVLSECFGKKDRWPAFYQSVIEGYAARFPITEKEKAAAPLMTLGIEMICIASFSDVQKYQDILNTNIQMLQWLKDLPELKI